jgi:hypothetical protein
MTSPPAAAQQRRTALADIKKMKDKAAHAEDSKSPSNHFRARPTEFVKLEGPM